MKPSIGNIKISVDYLKAPAKLQNNLQVERTCPEKASGRKTYTMLTGLSPLNDSKLLVLRKHRHSCNYFNYFISRSPNFLLLPVIEIDLLLNYSSSMNLQTI